MNDSQVLQVEEPVFAPIQHKPRPTHRILVVDDDSFIRQLNAESLRLCGYHVATAADGAAAWDALNADYYDLMITDNRMPKVTGLEVLKKLHAARMDMPVIMATGILPMDEFARCPWLRPTATLVKPYTITELLGTVQEVLRVTDDIRVHIAPPPNWKCLPSDDELQS